MNLTDTERQRTPHFRYSYYQAAINGDDRHLMDVLKSIGMTYRKAIAQPIADQWLLLDCQNVPEQLSNAFSEADLSAEDLEFFF